MNRKALALLSGGLDSTLAIKLLLDQGVEVVALNFISPFCQCNSKTGCQLEARKVVDKFGIDLKVIGLSKEYLEMVKNPVHGYGKNMNPCIDCRILMLKKTKEYMKEIDASFIITGEVLGQRPMSQRRDAMRVIEKEAGMEGLILRPLSARLLPPTIPEIEGIVDRERLLAFSGRSRKPQMALAKNLQINEYPCAAGGCLLTDPEFAGRMRDLLKFTPEPTMNDIQLLKIGRHFRLSDTLKIIVGRNEEENKRLLVLAKEKDIRLGVVNHKGPVAIARGMITQNHLLKAASICARYSDDRGESGIMVSEFLSKEKVLSILPMDETELEKLRV